jgi:nicotinate-nucleotide--dimethylbenzimidazole phosphoribosyltransferase
VSLLESTIRSILPADEAARATAKARLDQLAMPHWALGRLMDLAVDLAGMTRSVTPPVARKAIVVMAADHGVVAEGVSKYPQAVTAQMVATFVRGGAGINALARLSGARVVVVDMGVASDLGALAEAGRIVSQRIAPGTQNMAKGPAMARLEAVRAVEAGIEIARDLGPTVDVFGTGDMGIGNTTPSAAIAAVITGRAVAEVTGRGTGIDDEGLLHKVAVIERALEVNRPDPRDGLDVLAKVGGFEVGGLAGLILGAAAQRKPVVLDGFISTAGALIAYTLAPAVADYVVAAHRSTEKGHEIMLAHLGKKPLLDLGMRLGEGTGAALAMSLVEGAVRILTEVATFAEAAVSQAESKGPRPLGGHPPERSETPR